MTKEQHIHKGIGKEEASAPSGIMKYAIFEIRGDPDLGSGRYWKDFTRMSPLSPEDGGTPPKETVVYGAPFATLVLYLNRDIHYHEVHILVRKNLEDTKSKTSEETNPLKSLEELGTLEGSNETETINNIKLALEEKLKASLKDITNSLPDLLKDIEKN